MRALKHIWIVLIFLAGCAQLGFSPAGTIKVDQKLSPEAQAIQKSINEINIDLNAAAKTIDQDALGGVLTKEQAKSLIEKVKEARDAVDQAQAYLDVGNLGDANQRLKIEKNISLEIQRALAAQARKGN